jgi:hypothetical protein
MPNGDILGERLYQKRASKALPILVRQAELRTPILYSALAEEIGMPNPRNLNDVLECVGLRLDALSRDWGESVPKIQILVINKQTKLPSEGIGWLFEGKDREWYDSLPLKEQRRQLEIAGAQIYDYEEWPQVLEAIGLRPVSPDAGELVQDSATLGATTESRGSSFGAGGESKAHKNLKDFIALHPEILDLSTKGGNGKTEVPLPSGDKLDVHFVRGVDRIAVEVKSALSSLSDIVRGMFQCIKYRAVIEAEQASLGQKPSARAILVLETRLPKQLIGLRNMLGIELRDQVIPT